MATSTSMDGYFNSPASSSSSSRLSYSQSLSPQPRLSHLSHTPPTHNVWLSRDATRKHSPDASGHEHSHSHPNGHVFSLVHPHEQIQVPMPPSLRLRKPTSAHNHAPASHSNSGTWYDNDEFNGQAIGMSGTASSLHLDLDGRNHRRYMEDIVSDPSSSLLSRPSLAHSDSIESSSGSGSFGSSSSSGYFPLSSQGSPYPTSRPLPIPNVNHYNQFSHYAHSNHSGHSTPGASPTASPGPQGSKSLPPFLVLPLPTH